MDDYSVPVLTVGPNPRVVIRGEVLARMLRSPDGPVARDLLRRAKRVQDRSRQIVRVRSGGLRRDIAIRLTLEGGTLRAYVGSGNTAHALVEHEGSRPHVITGNPLLAFRVGGVLIVTTQVNHPGTTGSKYLTRALPEARY